MGHKYTTLIPDEENSGKLVVGPIDFIAKPEILDSMDINSIVCCTNGMDDESMDIIMRKIENENNFLMYKLDDMITNDFVSLINGDKYNLDYVTSWIHNKLIANQNILVYCDGGVTRSVSVCISYIMRYGLKPSSQNLMTFDDAVYHMYSIRECSDISLFREELITWEKICRKELSSNN